MKKHETSCCEEHWRNLVWVYVLGAVFVLLGIWLLGQSAAFAQDSDPPIPPRGIERDAPDREPVVLETRTLSNGVTSTLSEVPAAADTYIASGRPNQNFGADSLTVNALPVYSPRSFTVGWDGYDQGDAGIGHHDTDEDENLRQRARKDVSGFNRFLASLSYLLYLFCIR
jgi:hypothetical protein